MRRNVKYHYHNSTEQFHLWEMSTSDGAVSKLYIRKWRCPDTIPRTLSVTFVIDEALEQDNVMTWGQAHRFPERKVQPIVSTVERVSLHGRVMRFDTRRHDQQFSSIYVPYAILGSARPDQIQVIVDWQQLETKAAEAEKSDPDLDAPKTAQQANPANIFKFYEWQKRALSAWKEAGYVGVVEAVTGAGKTHVALAAIQFHLKAGWQVVVLVPSVALQQQWYKSVSRITREPISLLGGEGTLIANSRVTIAVAASGAKYQLHNSTKNGLIIADECHRYGSATWSRALEDNFERRLGLTATYEREDNGVEEVLDPYFSGVCYSLGYEEALEDGVISDFKIAFVGVDFSDEERGAYEFADNQCRLLRKRLIDSYGVTGEPFGQFMKEVASLAQGGNRSFKQTDTARSYLNNFSKRRTAIAGAGRKIAFMKHLVPCVLEAERTIIFTQTKTAAERAVNALKSGGSRVRAKVLDATMSLEERKTVFAAFESGEEDVVAAPMLLDEGVDVPVADLAVVLASSRSRRQMIQRMGRVLRKKQGDRIARIVILYVKGTSEDPEAGAHETFIDLITGSALDQRIFSATDVKQIQSYLNDYTRGPEEDDLGIDLFA